MKKYSIGLFILLICLSIFVLGFNDKRNKEPNLYYKVYLDDEIIGTIKSKDKLLRMIDSQGKYIKKKYQTNKVLAPDGLEIKKITTFSSKIDSAESVYKKIQNKKSFTVPGYQLTLKDGKTTQKVYTTKKNIIKVSLENTVQAFVGEAAYQSYKNETQTKIVTTGTEIENISIETHMTIKETNIPINKRIFTNESDLSKYILFGDSNKEKKYSVKIGDTIEGVAYNNQISPEEFLLYNPQFSSRTNLLFPGQEVTIGMIEPKVKVIVQSKVVSDIESKYKTEEQYDADRLVGDDEVVQAGENGLLRVKQTIYYMNGTLLRAETQGTEELKPSINAIIIRGEKVVPTIGSGAWYWPLNSYNYLRGLEYWIDPDDGQRKAHTGIDYGDNCGKPIYAANNGVVYQATSYYPNGNFVTINHNNGYYTLYAHMSRYIVAKGQTVAKGQIIGYVGDTGQAFGCHLHFEAIVGGPPYRGGTFIDARGLY